MTEKEKLEKGELYDARLYRLRLASYGCQAYHCPRNGKQRTQILTLAYSQKRAYFCS